MSTPRNWRSGDEVRHSDFTRAEWERQPNAAYRVTAESRDPSLIVNDITVTRDPNSAIEYNEYLVQNDERTQPPRLDWGPFSIAMAVTLSLLAMSAGIVVAAVLVSWWALLALIVTLPFVAICVASGVGVLYAPRRYWQAHREIAED